MDKKTYTEMMAAIAEGKTFSAKKIAELNEFAKSKKLKRAPESAVKTAAVKVVKEKAPKAKCDPSLHGSDETCEKDSRSNGVCAAHYSRLVYRQSEENAEKVREASRRSAAKQRELKAEQAAELAESAA